MNVVAVGPQAPEEGKAFGFPFAVLSDPGLDAAKKYGLLHEKGMLGNDVPRPATILIDADRTIRWIRAAENVRLRPTLDEVFEQLRK